MALPEPRWGDPSPPDEGKAGRVAASRVRSLLLEWAARNRDTVKEPEPMVISQGYGWPYVEPEQ